MRRNRGYGMVLGAWLLATSLLLHAHPGHQTSAEVECAGAAGRLEISLVVHEADMVQALNAQAESRVSFALTPVKQLDERILGYLKEFFLVRDASGAKAKLTWVGKEREGSEDASEAAWVIYFEAELAEGFAGATLCNGVFCEIFDDQINVVQVRQGKFKHSLGFSPYHGEKSLLP